ncbi:acyl carrier protein [Yinghuangia seranimata]|uniref:acyl carrier protein n=1 Tax=Yinghuangia seranimata TaxID=408067 RepID=UPI00248CBFCB|nr:acyl carrier protein [Yinghuangia seranimata]MDI2127238.1 acyl carrier protein [Yinghuangia seranimata]
MTAETTTVPFTPVQPRHVAVSADAILAELVAMLVEVVGEELLIATTVDRDSSFNADLAIESIEFVALAEKLENRYGSRVDFMAFLAELEMDEILEMTVGTLVDYIAAQLGGAGGEG